MEIEVTQVEYSGLQDALNQIGLVNLIKILASVEDGATVYTIIYINKSGSEINLNPPL